jgi:predicted MPP superfamily phosphohydrolase
MHSRLIILPIVIILFIGLLHGYAITGLNSIASSSLVFLAKNVLWTMLGIALLSILFIFISGNRLSKSLRNFFFAFVFIHLFSALVFDVFLLLDDIRRFLFFIFGLSDGARSSTFTLIGIGFAFLPAILFILGMFIGPYRYRVKEITVSLPKLPAAFEGLKIVQISDIHSGSFYNKKAVQRGINLILTQKADVIFFTGDLVNDAATEMDDYIPLFKQLTAPHGVYSILGNHDYGDYVQWPSEEAKAANLNELKNVHQKLGWRLLLNEHTYLTKDQAKIGLIGVENWGKGFHQMGDLAKAAMDCEAPVKILLSHDPTHWDAEVTQDYKDINLTLSGHTHGAQMGFEFGKYKWSPIRLRYKKWAGLYRLDDQFLYINRGFGFLGYPGRLGIWPEITSITLKNESNG